MTTSADTREFRQDLVADAENLGDIRRLIRNRLTSWGLKPIAYDVVTCANELLTNVHDHVGSSECAITLSRYRDRLRVTVSDNSSRLPVIGREPGNAEDGRGLILVNSLSSAWGTSLRSDGGKEVWFELPIPKQGLAA